MKSLDFGRCLLHAGAIGALLTGRSGSQSPISAPAAMRQDFTTSAQAMPQNVGSSNRTEA